MPVDTIFPLNIQSFLFLLCRSPAAFHDRRDRHVAHEALRGIGAGAKMHVQVVFWVAAIHVISVAAYRYRHCAAQGRESLWLNHWSNAGVPTWCRYLSVRGSVAASLIRETWCVEISGDACTTFQTPHLHPAEMPKGGACI